MEFNDYFDRFIEYPDPTTDPILPIGSRFDFISTTFLNGWINHVQIVDARLLNRYRTAEENLLAAKAFNSVGDGSNKRYHTDLDALKDDVVILARPGKDRADSQPNFFRIWWFFWYDRDCSDSCIGRFRTEDADESVISAFGAHADAVCADYGNSPALLLDPAAFVGWIAG
jgi:hypothetical protein